MIKYSKKEIERTIYKLTKYNRLVIETLSLARKRNKSDKEMVVLCKNINYLVELVKKGNSDVKNILLVIFLPLLKRATSITYEKYCRRYSNRIDIKDLFQQSYILFEKGLIEYDSKMASFPYFINIKVKKNLYSQIKTEIIHLKKTPISMVANSQARDRKYGGKNSVHEYFITKEIMKHMMRILNYYKKRAKTETTKKVCDEYMFGAKTCQEIADEVDVSYYAVYEIIMKIQNDFMKMINHNEICAYYVTPPKTGNHALKYEYQITKKPDNYHEKIEPIKDYIKYKNKLKMFNIPPASRNELKELINFGYSIKAISKMYNVSDATIKKWIKYYEEN